MFFFLKPLGRVQIISSLYGEVPLEYLSARDVETIKGALKNTQVLIRCVFTVIPSVDPRVLTQSPCWATCHVQIGNRVLHVHLDRTASSHHYLNGEVPLRSLLSI